jgi:hypothetical protein
VRDCDKLSIQKASQVCLDGWLVGFLFFIFTFGLSLFSLVLEWDGGAKIVRGDIGVSRAEVVCVAWRS